MLKGIFAPIPTPFVNEEIAYDKFKSNLAKWGKTNLRGIVVLGSNGEQPYIDEKEKVELWAFARENFPEDKLVIAGTGCESTKATIRVTKKAAEAGAQAALVISPHFFKASMNKSALENHYRKLADESPIPILLYNMPGNTGLNLTPPLVKALCTHPNIKGIKDSSGNIVQISEILRDVPEDFAVFAGSASFLMPALVMGAVGGTLATANVLPEQCVQIYESVKKGNLDEARKIQKSILKFNSLVTSKYGVAGLKAALDMVGYYGGLPRKPILPIGDNEIQEIKSELEGLGVL